MNKKLRIIGGLVFLVLAITTLTLIAKVTKPQGDADLPLIWHAPEFSLNNQHAELITTDALYGHVWIANFFFTKCTSACPMMTSKMVILQNQIKNPNVRFVSFSVDPAHDTTADLAKYAQSWNAQEQRWLLLQTQTESLADITKRLQVSVKATGNKADPISHSSTFFLFDQKGMLRGRYASVGDDMHRLVKDVGKLSANTKFVPAVALDSSGQQIYDNLRCASCHDHDNLAPTLAGLSGRTVTLSDNQTVIADAAYIRESIQNPNAKMVKGYVALMPAYKDYLNAEQLDRLVTYLQSLEAIPGTQSSAINEVHKDVFCNRDVRVTETTPRAVHANKTYYFCCPNCRASFVADPEAYVGKSTEE